MSYKLPPRILIIISDVKENTSLANTIERYWFNVVRATSVEESLILSEIYKFHMAIVSANTSDAPLVEFVQILRSKSKNNKLPMIFLFDNTESLKKLHNMDYLDNFVITMLKPFDLTLLMTNIRNLFRRSKPVCQDRILRYKSTSIDIATYRVFHNDQEIHLGPIECKILQFLLENANQACSRDQIINYVWGIGHVIKNRTVDVHVNRIRSALNKSGEDVLHTIRGVGYCIK
ncbi:winged helix-turn-helix domain-containing protein [Rickettsia endosymbiont of Cardiosporidium cionae]|uniref:winged helix-turn-helix domain-containing protein n=1 Tax=Rickettsia endosymbiont of Cardiosporidium cionae TaxID=2777155 RepID=UPI0018935013|nr:response regulator transcription factor [Rickettsia endosymbiont of Cardiosporidium cionae]KAF8818125.1 response regulator [Rickettsia endosymbiont of Cardiosporidium cionae]